MATKQQIRLILVLETLAMPACFNSEKEWELYKKAAVDSPFDEGFSFCEDCTKKYRNEMVRANRCQNAIKVPFVSYE